MHVIALFGILLLIFLRAVGFIISIEFLRDLKESKFKIGTFVFDIKYFLKSNKVKLDENRRVRGSMI